MIFAEFEVTFVALYCRCLFISVYKCLFLLMLFGNASKNIFCLEV